MGMHALSALLHAMAMAMGLLAIHQSIGPARHPYLFTVYLLQQRKRSCQLNECVCMEPTNQRNALQLVSEQAK
jgi:hypothetical protein